MKAIFFGLELLASNSECAFSLSRGISRINIDDEKKNATQAQYLFTCKGSEGMSSAASMIAVLCLGLILTVGDAALQKGSSVRQRRSLMNLSSMVSDVTGRQSTDFVSYGNYCGLGGSGQPVDPIDECCQVHDLCYNLSSKGVCQSLGEKGVYQVEYQWSKAKDGLAVCGDDQDKCKTTICMCDAILTNCLKTNLEFYNSQNLHKLSLFELLQEANYISEP